MDKNTKMLAIAAGVVVIGYMLWQKKEEEKVAAAAPASPQPVAVAKDYNIPVLGAAAPEKVATPAVSFAASNENVEATKWGNANGTNIAPTFFQVKNSFAPVRSNFN